MKECSPVTDGGGLSEFVAHRPERISTELQEQVIYSCGEVSSSSQRSEVSYREEEFVESSLLANNESKLKMKKTQPIQILLGEETSFGISSLQSWSSCEGRAGD